MSGKNKQESPQRKGDKPGANPRKDNTSIISFKEKDIAQRWLVTTENCPTCAEIKRDFKKDFKSGKMKATDVGDDMGFRIITELGIQEVPVFIVELKDGHPSGVKFILDE